MDQEIRNKLRNVVTQCRKLLEDSVSQELEGKYGIFARRDQVTADPDAKMAHLTEEEQAARKDILDHFGHIKARGFKPKDALDQLVREIAFTHLNRLCAYKMMEAREVYVGGQKFREAVSRGANSNGVKFYLAEHEEDERLFNTGHQDVAYRHFLDWLGGALSDEIGVLFNPNDPANRLYPRQKTLDEVLELLNEGGIKAEEIELREQWPKIWSQDETIGWVYQYFTPKELRDQARKESQAPRNSYELAFRNQFFTPRYVVEFLTDNTLGRIWYEMRKGETKLKDQCRYMVRRPTETFLKEGEQPPKDATEGKDDLSQEELFKLPVHIPHRPKKDPRDLKILDPACGSGHFLLYCFDLLLTIYEEAYADPDIGPALKKDYLNLEDMRRDVPRLILAHNLHGIDIDLRCSQIAALALWLRCQRAYQGMELKTDRPRITRSNFVCAEPMPGEYQMLQEFVAQLEPKLLGQVVEVVFDKMKLAGEVGSLFKIEEEIRDVVAAAKKQWVRETSQATDRKGQPLLFTQAAIDRLAGKPEQSSLFDLSDITDDQFFEQAEVKVIETLRQYAEKAHNGQKLQRRLFTEDAVRGFAFVDVCHKRFDVVLMNPPFGELASAATDYIDKTYKQHSKNILCAFIERYLMSLADGGRSGSVLDRTVLIKNSYEAFRRNILLKNRALAVVGDLGWGVLDANVEVSSLVISKQSAGEATAIGYDVTNAIDKAGDLLTQIPNPIEMSHDALGDQPFASISFQMPVYLRQSLRDFAKIGASGVSFYNGHTIKSDVFKRLVWEIPPNALGASVKWMWNGSAYSPFYVPFQECVIVTGYAGGLGDHRSTIIRNPSKHDLPGLCFGKRGDFLDVQIMPSGFVLTNEGFGGPASNSSRTWFILALLNSLPAQCALNFYCGQHKGVGYVNALPVPKTSPEHQESVVEITQHLYNIRRISSRALETDPHFVCISQVDAEGRKQTSESWLNAYDSASKRVQQLVTEIDDAFLDTFNVDDVERKILLDSATRRPLVSAFCDLNHEDRGEVKSFWTKAILSHAAGCAFGRWDIRFATGEKAALELPDPFAPLPVCPPGQLQNAKGLPARPEDVPAEYPVRISWDGILLDDPNHPMDIECRVREVFETIWGGAASTPKAKGITAETIEHEACEILGVNELRDYFRKPGKGGFWDDHIIRYSKSRRKAPIYWLLQSSKKNYSLWLYYHRLDKDLLFKALVNYVEPKIRLETSRLETLRSQKAAAGDTGKEAKRLAKDVERQEDFLSELRDFEDKLRRAANLHLEPDLNDGVVLNIAPLWELVPWKEAKKYWDELMDGQYEWSSIGKQLRQKGLVK